MSLKSNHEPVNAVVVHPGTAPSVRGLDREATTPYVLGAFSFAAVLTAGPFLCSSLAALAFGPAAHDEQTRLGLALVAYAAAFSMIAFGPFQLGCARILRDLRRAGRVRDYSAVLAQMMGPLLAVLSLSGAAFLTCIPLDPASRAAAFTLYLVLGGTWLALVPLFSAKECAAVTAIFAVGLSVGGALALGLGLLYGLPGLLGGLAAGQGLVFAGLLARADRQFGPPVAAVADLWRRCFQQRALMVAGAAYGLGLWIDKLIFWFHPAAPGQAIAGGLRLCPVYDSGMALAALTTLPAIATFLWLAETDLADRVQAYFSTLKDHIGQTSVEVARNALVETVYRNFSLIAQVQAAVTLGVVLFSPEIVSTLNLPFLSVFIFRIGAVGAFMQVLFMASLAHLLYLDRTRFVAGLALFFLGTNALFTLLAMGGGLQAFGFGFAAACALSLFAAFWVLDSALRDLALHSPTESERFALG